MIISERILFQKKVLYGTNDEEAKDIKKGTAVIIGGKYYTINYIERLLTQFGKTSYLFSINEEAGFMCPCFAEIVKNK